MNIRNTKAGVAGKLKGAVLSSILTLAPLAMAGQAHAEPRELIYNIFIPSNATIYKEGLFPWAEAVEKASNGALKVTVPTSSLTPVPRLFDGLQDGLYDMAVIPLAFRDEQIALPTFLNIPMISPVSTEKTSLALWETHKKFFESIDEYKDFIPLTLFTLGGTQFMTVDKDIASVADLKNLKLHTEGRVSIDVLKELGAAPVGAPGVQMFELISGKVVDGTLAMPGPAASLGLSGVVQKIVEVPGGMFRPAYCICINRQVFEGLTADEQAALVSTSGAELSARLGAVSGKEDEIGLKEMTEKGAKFVPASEELQKDIAASSDFVRQNWLKAAGERGVDGEAALKFFQEKIAQ